MLSVKIEPFNGIKFSIGNLQGTILTENYIIEKTKQITKSLIKLEFSILPLKKESIQYYKEGIFFTLFSYFNRTYPDYITIEFSKDKKQLIKFLDNNYIRKWIGNNLFPKFTFYKRKEFSKTISYTFKNNLKSTFDLTNNFYSKIYTSQSRQEIATDPYYSDFFDIISEQEQSTINAREIYESSCIGPFTKKLMRRK